VLSVPDGAGWGQSPDVEYDALTLLRARVTVPRQIHPLEGFYRIDLPPSMGKVTPVTNEASSLARNKIA
jgi:hypothetical protein